MKSNSRPAAGVVSAAEALASAERNERADARRLETKAANQGRLVLLTAAEAAARLRCSLDKVKRLRLSGKLPFIPGRPPMIEEADLHAYVEGEKRRRLPPPTSEEIRAQEDAMVRQRARRAWLRHHLGSRR